MIKIICLILIFIAPFYYISEKNKELRFSFQERRARFHALKYVLKTLDELEPIKNELNSVVELVENIQKGVLLYDQMLAEISNALSRYHLLAFRRVIFQEDKVVLDFANISKDGLKMFRGSFQESKYFVLRSESIFTPQRITLDYKITAKKAKLFYRDERRPPPSEDESNELSDESGEPISKYFDLNYTGLKDIEARIEQLEVDIRKAEKKERQLSQIKEEIESKIKVLQKLNVFFYQEQPSPGMVLNAIESLISKHRMKIMDFSALNTGKGEHFTCFPLSLKVKGAYADFIGLIRACASHQPLLIIDQLQIEMITPGELGPTSDIQVDFNILTYTMKSTQ